MEQTYARIRTRRDGRGFILHFRLSRAIQRRLSQGKKRSGGWRASCCPNPAVESLHAWHLGSIGWVESQVGPEKLASQGHVAAGQL